MEPRLKKRYEQLVRAHMHSNNALAAGVKSTLDSNAAFSQTQAAWRFLNNERCTLEKLTKPLLQAAYDSIEKECDSFVLIPHDWSHLGYNKHSSKKDTYNTFKKCIGYDLQSSLAISDRHGGPLALVAMNLKTKDETFSSYGQNLEGLTHLEELSKRIDWLESQSFKKPLVHIVDREGDSVAFFRACENKYWLIRVNETNRVHDGISEKKMSEIVKDLQFTLSRTIEYKGTPANQYLAEKEVTIRRAAHPKRKDSDGKRRLIKGGPVKVRLIISQIKDETGKELATWYLLSNLLTVEAPTLALWYYWRWSIESYFKLMKTAGMQLEAWQQTTGLAVARRLLVASMACVCVWQIAHAKGPEAGELRKVLIRLSGRQMKRRQEFTYNALLAGLCSLLAMRDMLETYNIDKVKLLLNNVFTEKELV